MKEEIIKEGVELIVNKLELLAREMGTTVEYLWGVLAKQAFVMGSTNIGILLILAIIAPFWSRFAKHVYGLTTCDEDSWDNDIMIPIYIISGAYVIVTIITTIILIPEIVTCFVNPEYWALNKILRFIK